MPRPARWSSNQYNLFKDPKRNKRELEKVLVRAIKKYCKSRAIPCYRMNSGGIKKGSNFIELAPAGTPDLLTFYRGYAVWIECKQVGEEPEPHQTEMHEWLRGQGLFVIVAEEMIEVQRFYYDLEQKIRRGELPVRV